jgi:hypothetical protein
VTAEEVSDGSMEVVNVQYEGAARLPVQFPKTVFPAAFERTNVGFTVGLVVVNSGDNPLTLRTLPPDIRLGKVKPLYVIVAIPLPATV